MTQNTQHTEVASSHSQGNNLPPFLTPDLTLLLLTWVTFFALLAILYKYAWKPILSALDVREQSIRKSLEDVDLITSKMEKIDEKCAQLITEAETKAKDVIVQSRQAAKEAAYGIEGKAREEAKISLENALRDIKAETQKAQIYLREESAQIAVELAGKIIEENITMAKNRKLINRFIKDI